MTMSKWILALCALVCGAILVASDADAKRLGGGRSVGAQRSVTAPPPSAVPAKPAQQTQQAAPAQQQGGSRWLPMLGGLALGGLLGYFLGGSPLGTILLVAMLAFIGFALWRVFSRRRAEEPVQNLQYAAGPGEERVSLGAAPQPGAASTPASEAPAGFDAAGFLKAAKMNFVKLQLANDAGELDEIREFTTSEMFDELRKDVLSRPSSAQQTDVINLNADLLEVAAEKNEHWASVRFSGLVRETRGTEPVGFEEVWNLVKPADGSSGWLLAGIQQMH
jgi:predicted lipid-binding transport protein (Tim44 family)